MNKRARTRLIGVTVIIVLVVGAILLTTGRGDGAYYKTVKDVSEDNNLVGERVKVGGAVVAGSWDRKSNPMTFRIQAEDDETGDGPTIKVVYNGGVPSTFGDGVVAIVTGELDKDKTITSSDMITKCPSKYESKGGALPVSDLIGKGATLEGKTVKITGFVKPDTIVPPGGTERFLLVAKPDGAGDSVPIFYEGALPEGMDGGSEVVITGSLESDGKFVASDVALSK